MQIHVYTYILLTSGGGSHEPPVRVDRGSGIHSVRWW